MRLETSQVSCALTRSFSGGLDSSERMLKAPEESRLHGQAYHCMPAEPATAAGYKTPGPYFWYLSVPPAEELYGWGAVCGELRVAFLTPAQDSDLSTAAWLSACSLQGLPPQSIPTLIVLDPQGEVITRQGRVEVLNDEDCREFPWHPKPVLELSDSNAVQLNEGPCLVLFVDSEDDGESEAAKQLIQPIAEKIIAKYKAKEEEAPLLFFVAGEDDMTDSLRDYTNLPEAAPLLTILDMSARAKYVMDVEEITPAIVEAFVNDFLAEKLKPEPI
ncbi:hypothetical protein HPG69_015659 [Diceros bicornis minor]|uniref:Nucleoredoxin n=1 Tax=Diceros bicornis minor TaxID=77932 RepID=A0A7J7E7A0_DICBM|nr:hypothetical protein HPG69_015659 [Diceros bicornis minor]